MSAALKPEPGLESGLHALCEAQPFATRFFVKLLGTGQVIARDADTKTPSASTRKVSIIMAALAAAHAGRLDLDEQIPIEDRLKVGVASGTYRYMTSGYVIPLRDAITNMIITSDNVCTQMVLERLSLDEMNAFCAGLGMTGTRHVHLIPPPGLPADHPVTAETYTTAADQALLLELILRGAIDPAASERLGCTPALCAHALDVLSWQQFRTMIPGLLPFETRVCNKTGRGKRGRMDVGLVYRGDRPAYIMTAFTDGVPETMPDGLPGYAAAYATIARLSRACWEAV